jgi:hypothetical protein
MITATRKLPRNLPMNLSLYLYAFKEIIKIIIKIIKMPTTQNEPNNSVDPIGLTTVTNSPYFYPWQLPLSHVLI